MRNPHTLVYLDTVQAATVVSILLRRLASGTAQDSDLELLQKHLVQLDSRIEVLCGLPGDVALELQGLADQLTPLPNKQEALRLAQAFEKVARQAEALMAASKRKDARFAPSKISRPPALSWWRQDRPRMQVGSHRSTPRPRAPGASWSVLGSPRNEPASWARAGVPSTS